MYNTWMKLKIIMPSEKSYWKWIYNKQSNFSRRFREFITIPSDRKQTGICLGTGKEKRGKGKSEGSQRHLKQLWGMMVCSLSWLWGCFPSCIHISKLRKFYILIMCTLYQLYSINQLFKMCTLYNTQWH